MSQLKSLLENPSVPSEPKSAPDILPKHYPVGRVYWEKSTGMSYSCTMTNLHILLLTPINLCGNGSSCVLGMIANKPLKNLQPQA